MCPVLLCPQKTLALVSPELNTALSTWDVLMFTAEEGSESSVAGENCAEGEGD